MSSPTKNGERPQNLGNMKEARDPSRKHLVPVPACTSHTVLGACACPDTHTHHRRICDVGRGDQERSAAHRKMGLCSLNTSQTPCPNEGARVVLQALKRSFPKSQALSHKT